ncbi:putative protein phosphatase 2C 53 [Wolffia australiana]
MACSVAMAGLSPAFSPSQRKISLACKAPSETLTLQNDLRDPAESPSPSSSASSSSSSSSSSITTSSRTGLKRKRPLSIRVPPAQAFDQTDRSCRGEAEVELESRRFAVFCKRGRKRMELEDRFNVPSDSHGDSETAFFGIFDGHGGAAAAEFAATNMDKHVLLEISAGGRRKSEGCAYAEAVRAGYLKTDAEFLNKQVPGGASCVTALIVNGDVVISNAGDCRAVLSSAGAAEALTSDHRPSREDERDRIESLGGYVDFCHGSVRVNGSLAVSRGIGDGHLKQWVIAEPETRVFAIGPESEFLILASDGLWDKVSNQEAVDLARPLCMKSNKQSLLSACKKLVHLSLDRGSADDVSVMIIRLGEMI